MNIKGFAWELRKSRLQSGFDQGYLVIALRQFFLGDAHQTNSLRRIKSSSSVE